MSPRMKFGCVKFTFNCLCDYSKLPNFSSPYLVKTGKITRKELKFHPKCPAGVMMLHENMLHYVAQMESTNAKEDMKKDRLEWRVPHQGKLLEGGEFLIRF